MKSKVQSYDLRDSEKYYGILELEKLLQDSDSTNITMFNDAIQRKDTNIFKEKMIAKWKQNE